MAVSRIETIAASVLKPHEKTSMSREKQVLEEIRRYGGVHAIVVSEDFVVLDGHHRLACLKKLGAEKIPAVVVDYFSENVSVKPRRKIPVSKELVVSSANSGKLLPHKTTRHEYSFKLPSDRIRVFR